MINAHGVTSMGIFFFREISNFKGYILTDKT